MKILFLSSNIPHHKDIGGEYIRTANQAKELAARGHQLHVLCLRPDDQKEEWGREVSTQLEIPVEQFPWRWPRHPNLKTRIRRKLTSVLTGRNVWELGYEPRLAARLLELKSGFRPDVVHVDSAQMGVYGPDISPHPALWFLADHPILAAEGQLDFARGFIEQAKLRSGMRSANRYFAKFSKYFAALFFVARADKEKFLLDHPAADVRVAANGIDLGAHPFLKDREPEAGCLLFTGNFGAPHNLQAALFFLRRVWPALKSDPSFKYFAVGANPPDELNRWNDGQRVTVTGYVPSLRPYFARAQVYVCTIVSGAGMLNKLQEAIALGVPVVCTKKAADGLCLIDKEHVLVADAPDAIVGAIRQIVSDPDGAAKRAQRARNFMETSYTWAAHAQELERAYEKMLQPSLNPRTIKAPL